MRSEVGGAGESVGGGCGGVVSLGGVESNGGDEAKERRQVEGD